MATLVPNPTPSQILAASWGQIVELPFNAEIFAIRDEDGTRYQLQCLRMFDIESQKLSGEYRDWAIEEHYDCYI